MKKISLLITLAFLAFSASLFGQKSDNVTLNVKINPIQTIVVNSNQKTVELNYLTKDDYKNGITSTQENHLTINSTGAFEVTVNSDKDQLTANTNFTKSIAAADIKISAMAGKDKALDGNFNTGITLSKDKKILISKSSGALDKNVNISYAASGGDKYLENYVKGTAITYTATVTYTLEPK